MILEDVSNLVKHGKGKCKQTSAASITFSSRTSLKIKIRTDLNVSCHRTEGILKPLSEYQVWIVVFSRPKYAFSPVSF
jgi:hypothetical protein